MASTSSTSAQVLMNKGKCGAAAYIHAECSNPNLNAGCPEHLSELLGILLSPSKPVDDWETIDWCKWLMAGGRTPDEFANTGGYNQAGEDVIFFFIQFFNDTRQKVYIIIY